MEYMLIWRISGKQEISFQSAEAAAKAFEVFYPNAYYIRDHNAFGYVSYCFKNRVESFQQGNVLAMIWGL